MKFGFIIIKEKKLKLIYNKVTMHEHIYCCKHETMHDFDNSIKII